MDRTARRRRPMLDLTRRGFIALVGSAAAAWPLAVRAQQPDRVRRIGVLMSNAEDSAEGQARVTALVKGLEQLGWSDGRNVRIDYRWTGDAERLRRNEIAAGHDTRALQAWLGHRNI